MNKNSLYIIIVALFIGNIWLIYTNKTLSDWIKINQLQTPYEEKSINDESWGFEKTGNTIAKINHPDVPKFEETKLLVFFTDIGCQFTIEYEVQLLNDLYKTHSKRTKIFLLSNHESYLKRLYDAKFEYELINIDHNILDNEFNFTNPVSIITGERSIVQSIHIAEKDNNFRSEIFYEKVDALFKSL